MSEKGSRRKKLGMERLELAVSSQAMFGKIPPSAIDLEEAVLGAVMLEKDAMDEVVGMLPEDAFYKDAHQKIYAACKALYGRAEPIDILTVTIELRRTENLDIVGGAFAITQLTNRVASAANIIYHVRIILQKYAQREIIRLSSQAIKDAFSEETDIFELVERVDNDVQQVRESLFGKTEMMEWGDQLREVEKKIETMYRAEVKLSGVPTGNPKLDTITGGWQDTDLIIIAARPSQGKSTRLINIAKAACMAGKNVAMFSLEMSWEQIIRKFINEESEVWVKKLVSGDITNVDLDKVKASIRRLLQMNFYLNDKAAITPSYIRSICKKRSKKRKIDILLIDYAQIMSPNEKVRGQSRDNELGTISLALKNLAKELRIPVVMLCQLSRKCEERTNKRPILSDLRESGSLEQDSDLVMGIYRPSYYYDLVKDPDYKDETINGAPMTEEDYNAISELLLLKHRNGETGVIKERFYGQFSRFVPSEEDSMPAIESYRPDNSNRLINGNPNISADKFITSEREQSDPIWDDPQQIEPPTIPEQPELPEPEPPTEYSPF